MIGDYEIINGNVLGIIYNDIDILKEILKVVVVFFLLFIIVVLVSLFGINSFIDFGY